MPNSYPTCQRPSVVRLLLSLLWVTTGVAMAIGSEPVIMEPFRVRPTDLYFNIRFIVETDAVTEIRVAGVAPGSNAEKIGIRKGDLLTSIIGINVVGKRRRSLVGKDDRIRALGKLTFEGRRGLFGKRWSVTVESQALRDPNEAGGAASPASPSVTSRPSALPAPDGTAIRP